MEAITLEELLGAPTNFVPEIDEDSFGAPVDDHYQYDVDLEFDPIPASEEIPASDEDQEDKVVIHKITKEEAKSGAEIVVSLLDIGNKLALTPLARWKATKKRIGDKERREKYMRLYEKEEFEDAELTEAEQKKVNMYRAYLRDKEQMESTIPFTAEEREALVNSCTKYFQDKNISIGGQNSFFGQLAMIETMKLAAIGLA